jgi:ADP-heptose:LPS heptosyltransferase
MKSLLVIKPSSLGDIVHGLQVLQTVARQRPDLRISWVVRDRFAGLVQAAPFVHEAIVFRRGDGWRAFWRLLGELRRRRFDAVWDLQGLLRSGLMTAAARTPEKWGRRDAREGARWFYNRWAEPPDGDGPHHALEVLLPFARAAGVEPALQFPLELKAGQTYLWQDFFAGDPRRTFVIVTDSRDTKKQWPGFDELTRLILATVADSRVAWCAAGPVQPRFPPPPGRFLNLTGCPLEEMIALVRQPSIFVGNDNGPMHLAAAAGHRVLAIFGPTSPRRFGPFPPDSPRHGVVTAPQGHLDRLAPVTVFAALAELCGRPEPAAVWKIVVKE